MMRYSPGVRKIFFLTVKLHVIVTIFGEVWNFSRLLHTFLPLCLLGHKRLWNFAVKPHGLSLLQADWWGLNWPWNLRVNLSWSEKLLHVYATSLRGTATVFRDCWLRLGVTWTVIARLSVRPVCYRCVDSKQGLPLLHVWNHFVFPCFWSILCNRLADIIVKEIAHFGPNTPCGQEFTKYHKNSKISCLNLIYFFACTSTSSEYIALWVLYWPPIKPTGGISDVFLYLSCRLEPYCLRFLGRVMYLVLKCSNTNFLTWNSFLF